MLARGPVRAPPEDGPSRRRPERGSRRRPGAPHPRPGRPPAARHAAWMRVQVSSSSRWEVLAEILRRLRYLDHRRRGEDRRVVEVFARQVLLRRLVRGRVVDEVGDRRPRLRIEDEVDEPVGVLRMRRALGDGQGVFPEQPPFLRHDVAEIVVLGHDLEDVAVPLHGEVDLAGDEQILAVVLGERLDVRLLPDDELLDLLDARRIGLVVRVAQVLETDPDESGPVAEHCDTAGVRIRIVEVLPARGRLAHRRLPVPDADGPPHVGQAVLAPRIERGVTEHRGDVRHVGDPGVIEGLEHPGHDHALDVVVGRDDHVVSRVAFLQLGEELVIVREEVHLDLDPGRRLEVVEGGLADVGVPVVEVELRLLGRPADPRRDGEARHGRAGAGEERAAGHSVPHRSFHRGVSLKVSSDVSSRSGSRQGRGSPGPCIGVRLSVSPAGRASRPAARPAARRPASRRGDSGRAGRGYERVRAPVAADRPRRPARPRSPVSPVSPVARRPGLAFRRGARSRPSSRRGLGGPCPRPRRSRRG